MDKKVLVITGATGFIGSHLVEEGLRRGWETIAWGRENSQLFHLPDELKLIRPGFTDYQAMADALQKLQTQYGQIDYFIHNAGVTKTLRINEYIEANANNTFRLVEVMRKTGIKPLRFVLMSSLAAVGPGNPYSLKPISPEDTPHPNTAYGQSKLMAEHFVRLSDLNWNIIRPTGVYGPRETDYMLMFRTVSQGLATKVGFETHYLTFIYVKDLVKAVFLALESPYVGKTFHVSDGKTYTDKEFRDICVEIINPSAFKLTVPEGLLELATLIAEPLGKITGKVPTLNRDKLHTLTAVNWKCDITETIKLLNYTADYDLRRGIQETWSYYRERLNRK